MRTPHRQAQQRGYSAEYRIRHPDRVRAYEIARAAAKAASAQAWAERNRKKRAASTQAWRDRKRARSC
jgi:hypothetical protein